jgi:hypothetical protein
MSKFYVFKLEGDIKKENNTYKQACGRKGDTEEVKEKKNIIKKNKELTRKINNNNAIINTLKNNNDLKNEIFEKDEKINFLMNNINQLIIKTKELENELLEKQKIFDEDLEKLQNLYENEKISYETLYKEVEKKNNEIKCFLGIKQVFINENSIPENVINIEFEEFQNKLLKKYSKNKKSNTVNCNKIFISKMIAVISSFVNLKKCTFIDSSFGLCYVLNHMIQLGVDESNLYGSEIQKDLLQLGKLLIPLEDHIIKGNFYLLILNRY